MEQNPFAMILEAGKIRLDAGKQFMQADQIEATVRLLLDQDNVTLNSTVLTPGVTLCVMHGGPAHGMHDRLSMHSMQKPMIMVPGIVLPVPYEPAVMIQMHGLVVGAILPPKDELRKVIEELRDTTFDDAIALSMCRMVTLAVGMNTEFVYGIIRQMSEAMKGVPDHLAGPVMLNVGQMQ